MSPSNSKEPQRIAKLLARAGIASRREIERMIAEGRIALNGTVLETPATVLPSLEGVTVDGEPVAAPAPARLFRYHKPSGLLTTEHDPAGRPTIYDRLPRGLPRVMPVGRLDLATEGLLLLTTDGELKRELELPATGVERSYRARAYGNVTQPQLEELMLGVEIEGVRYGSIDANIERRTGANLWIELTLTEGKNREVRRVLEHLGLQVSRLIRTRYGPFHLGDLPAGDVDEIRPNDLLTFRTVLSKPGGGKAASNLQFSVRARVPEAAPKPEPVAPTARARPARPGRMAVEPDGVRSKQQPRFTPRATPQARGADREPAGADRQERAERQPRSRTERDGNFTPRSAPATGRSRPERGERDASRPAPRSARTERPEREARFTPRGTPAARADQPDRAERETPRTVAKPARAARARAHREAQAPRAGDIVDRPRPPRPGKGPASGRGKPSVKPGGKPGRPPRTRK